MCKKECLNSHDLIIKFLKLGACGMESLFGECNNRFTVELLSELFLLNQSEIIRILKKNISNFEFSYCSQSAISEMDLDGQCIVDNFCKIFNRERDK